MGQTCLKWLEFRLPCLLYQIECLSRQLPYVLIQKYHLNRNIVQTIMLHFPIVWSIIHWNLISFRSSQSIIQFTIFPLVMPIKWSIHNMYTQTDPSSLYLASSPIVGALSLHFPLSVSLVIIFLINSQSFIHFGNFGPLSFLKVLIQMKVCRSYQQQALIFMSLVWKHETPYRVCPQYNWNQKEVTKLLWIWSSVVVP